jgi:hypothetical protein
MQFDPNEKYWEAYTLWGAILLLSAFLFVAYVIYDLIVALK